MQISQIDSYQSLQVAQPEVRNVIMVNFDPDRLFLNYSECKTILEGD